MSTTPEGDLATQVDSIRLTRGGWKVAQFFASIDRAAWRHAKGSITNAINQDVVVWNDGATLRLTPLGEALAQKMGWPIH